MTVVFMDTETLGLDPAAPIWEFAAIRRSTPSGIVELFHCFIDHIPSPWLDDLPTEFRGDYKQRFNAEKALTESRAAELIKQATDGAHIVGAVPNFDTERLTKLLYRHGITPGWHYHLIDVENLIVGFLAGRASRGDIDAALAMPDWPWKSESLSLAVGVDPEDFKRHTAEGDACWVEAQYDAVIGRTCAA